MPCGGSCAAVLWKILSASLEDIPIGDVAQDAHEHNPRAVGDAVRRNEMQRRCDKERGDDELLDKERAIDLHRQRAQPSRFHHGDARLADQQRYDARSEKTVHPCGLHAEREEQLTRLVDVRCISRVVALHAQNDDDQCLGQQYHDARQQDVGPEADAGESGEHAPRLAAIVRPPGHCADQSPDEWQAQHSKEADPPALDQDALEQAQCFCVHQSSERNHGAKSQRRASHEP